LKSISSKHDGRLEPNATSFLFYEKRNYLKDFPNALETKISKLAKIIEAQRKGYDAMEIIRSTLEEL
jgi:hypothetical protein